MKRKMRNPVILVSFIILICVFFGGVSVCAPIEGHTKHFVLVHGACLGAWSWYKLVPLLESYGHNVTAIDLAASGINLLRTNEIRTFSDYSKPLMHFMESIAPTQRVILVGHSFGGAAISQAMELFPQKVSVGVFLTAVMPGPSLPFSLIIQQALSGVASALDNKLSYDEGPNNPPTTFLFGPKYIRQILHQYSPPQDPALTTLLVRPVRLTTGEELVFSAGKYGSVKRVFIIVENDHVLPKQIQKWMIEKNPPNRVERIIGSDHMVMASQPVQLLVHLLDIALAFS